MAIPPSSSSSSPSLPPLEDTSLIERSSSNSSSANSSPELTRKTSRTARRSLSPPVEETTGRSPRRTSAVLASYFQAAPAMAAEKQPAEAPKPPVVAKAAPKVEENAFMLRVNQKVNETLTKLDDGKKPPASTVQKIAGCRRLLLPFAATAVAFSAGYLAWKVNPFHQ
jgi:hypothetical protein